MPVRTRLAVLDDGMVVVLDIRRRHAVDHSLVQLAQHRDGAALRQLVAVAREEGADVIVPIDVGRGLAPMLCADELRRELALRERVLLFEVLAQVGGEAFSDSGVGGSLRVLLGGLEQRLDLAALTAVVVVGIVDVVPLVVVERHKMLPRTSRFCTARRAVGRVLEYRRPPYRYPYAGLAARQRDGCRSQSLGPAGAVSVMFGLQNDRRSAAKGIDLHSAAVLLTSVRCAKSPALLRRNQRRWSETNVGG